MDWWSFILGALSSALVIGLVATVGVVIDSRYLARISEPKDTAGRIELLSITQHEQEETH